MRFIPFLLIAAVLVVSLFYSDRITQQNLAREHRDRVATSLRETQLAFSSQVYSFVRNSIRAVAAAHTEGNMDAQVLQALSEKAVAAGGRITRLEYAPGYTTSFVLPRKGNQHRIGKPPSLALPGESGQAVGNPRKVFPVVRRVSLIGNQAVEIGLLAPLIKTESNGSMMDGVVYLVVRIGLELPMMVDGSGRRNVDYLFNWLPGGPKNAVVQPAWVTGADMGPVGGTVDIPGGSFILLARHLENWQPTFADMLGYRLRLLAIALAVLVLGFMSNWLTFTRRSTRDRLAVAREQMSGVLENLTGAALTYVMPEGEERPSSADRIVFLNKSACREIWGVEADVAEADVMTLWDLVDVPGTGEGFVGAIAESARSMKPFHHIWPIHTLDGKLKWLDGRGYPRRMDDGSTKWSAIIFDTTGRIKHEQELEHQRELAYRAQKSDSIGQLSAGVAHDFNNHLAVILGNLELLLANEDRQKNKKLLDSAIAAALHGGELTKNMLAFARKARLSPEVLDLNELVRKTNERIGLTMPEAVNVESSLPSGIWKIWADRRATESSLLNLILNACDAMQGQGKLTIETSNFEVDHSLASPNHEDLSAGRYVMLALTDTGQGIERHLLDEIFEPFYSGKPHGQGTGLGLSVVSGFMKQSGGSIQVYSEPGHGTSFNLLFPVADSANEVVKEPEKLSLEVVGKGQKILLVEDEKEVRRVLVSLLEKADYAVVEASSGDAALKVFSENPDTGLLLTDIVMPGRIQGPDLAKTLRLTHPELPVVFITGYANDTSHDFQAGDIRIMKPVQRGRLLVSISRALRMAADKSNSENAGHPQKS